MGLESLRKWAKTIMDLKKKMQRGERVKRLSVSKILQISPRLLFYERS